MPRIHLILVGTFFLAMSTLTSPAEDIGKDYEIDRDIHYSPELDGTPGAERCVLDFYRPKNVKNYPTIVYFHGGGLAGGNKSIPKELMEKGWAVVAVNYRFSPVVKHPAYVQDAASAIAWTFKNIASNGGDPTKIFVLGISAGAYLGTLVTLDKSYLEKHGIDANQIAGLISVSGQMITHQTVRKEQGIEPNQFRPTIDEFAPLYHIRKDAPPILCTTGDWATDVLMRAEENLYFVSMMKLIGHPDIEHYIIKGGNHTRACKEAWPQVIEFINKKLTTPRTETPTSTPTPEPTPAI